MQPLVVDSQGVVRFKANPIVRWLVDEHDRLAKGNHARVDPALNRIPVMEFSREDREQLAMLLGYSVSGAGDLPYFSDERWMEAALAADAVRKGEP